MNNSWKEKMSQVQYEYFTLTLQGQNKSIPKNEEESWAKKFSFTLFSHCAKA